MKTTTDFAALEHDVAAALALPSHVHITSIRTLADGTIEVGTYSRSGASKGAQKCYLRRDAAGALVPDVARTIAGLMKPARRGRR